MENKTAIELFKSLLIELSKEVKSIPIEELMLIVNKVEKIEREYIAEVYSDGNNDGYHDGYNEGYINGCLDSIEYAKENNINLN
jgi:HEPN domain-containing protein